LFTAYKTNELHDRWEVGSSTIDPGTPQRLVRRGICRSERNRGQANGCSNLLTHTSIELFADVTVASTPSYVEKFRLRHQRLLQSVFAFGKPITVAPAPLTLSPTLVHTTLTDLPRNLLQLRLLKRKLFVVRKEISWQHGAWLTLSPESVFEEHHVLVSFFCRKELVMTCRDVFAFGKKWSDFPGPLTLSPDFPRLTLTSMPAAVVTLQPKVNRRASNRPPRPCHLESSSVDRASR
jgi:hypothetical protein